MKKSRMWTLAMALAATMSGAASSDKEDEDLSRNEEMTSFKPGPASVKDQFVWQENTQEPGYHSGD